MRLSTSVAGGASIQDSPLSDIQIPEIIGNKPIKDLINKIIITHRNHIARGIHKTRNNDLLLLGNSGTGKSLIVKTLAKVLAENGLLSKKEAVVLNAVTSLQNYLNEAEEHLEDLSGALVCIDNFQGLAHKVKDGSPIAELERLYEIKSMVEENGGQMMIVITGIDNGDISAYLRNNGNIAANFRHRVDLQDYTVDELVELTVYCLSSTYSMTIDTNAVEKLRRIFKQMVIDKDDQLEQNGKYVSKFAERIFDKSQQRDSLTSTVMSEDIYGKEYIKKTFE